VLEAATVGHDPASAKPEDNADHPPVHGRVGEFDRTQIAAMLGGGSSPAEVYRRAPDRARLMSAPVGTPFSVIQIGTPAPIAAIGMKHSRRVPSAWAISLR
jgi:hypothetical protein